MIGEQDDVRAGLIQIIQIFAHIEQRLIHALGAGVDGHDVQVHADERLSPLLQRQVERLEAFVLIAEVTHAHGRAEQRIRGPVGVFVLILHAEDFLKVDGGKAFHQPAEHRRVKDELAALLLHVGDVIVEQQGIEQLAGIAAQVEEGNFGMVLAVVPHPVGSKIIQFGQRRGQVILGQPQAFPQLHVDAIARSAHAYGHAVELAVYHEGLHHFGIHGGYLLHDVRTLTEIRAVALFNEAFHRHIGQAHQQHVIRARIRHHGLGEGFDIAGIVAAHVHGNFGVVAHKLVMRFAPEFAEDGQRAVFNSLRVQLEHLNPVIVVDQNIVPIRIEDLPPV